MNERAKQLADKAIDKAVSYTWTKLDYDQIQELLACHTELIVQECALTAALMEHDGRKNIGAAILDSFEIPLKSNVMAGAEQMAGDGGYQISTKEEYEAFAEQRNQSLRNRSTYFGGE
jgi:hypothetical protein